MKDILINYWHPVEVANKLTADLIVQEYGKTYEEQEPLSEEVFSKVWALESNIVRPLDKYSE